MTDKEERDAIVWFLRWFAEGAQNAIDKPGAKHGAEEIAYLEGKRNAATVTAEEIEHGWHHIARLKETGKAT